MHYMRYCYNYTYCFRHYILVGLAESTRSFPTRPRDPQPY